jgi:hypothetical protein
MPVLSQFTKIHPTTEQTNSVLLTLISNETSLVKSLKPSIKFVAIVRIFKLFIVSEEDPPAKELQI